MHDFGRIHAAAAIEGEIDDEPVNVTPGFEPRTHRGAIEQIHDLQNAARARAARSSSLAGRYSSVGLLLIAIGSFFGPEWFRVTAWAAGVLFGSRGWWMWENAAHARVEASLDATLILADADR